MSEALESSTALSGTLPAPDGAPQHGEPAVSSDVSRPMNPSPGAEALQQDEKIEPPKEEPKADDKSKPPREDPRDVRIRQQSAKLAYEAQAREKAEGEVQALRAKYEPREGGDGQPKPPSQAEIDRLVDQRAAAIAEQRHFDAECNKVAEAGMKEFADDFNPALATLWGMVDGLNANGSLNAKATTLIEAALEADKPAAVLYHLGKNPEEATRIAALSPAKMGAAVAKLSIVLEKAAATPKPVSKAPEPLEPVAGAARGETSLFTTKNTGDWIKLREQQLKASSNR